MSPLLALMTGIHSCSLWNSNPDGFQWILIQFCTDEDMFVCSGIRSVSFYEHIVTVGTGLGSLLFYDIRAQRFLEKPLNLTSGYRKCPGEGILRLTTGTGWVVCSPFHLYPERSQPVLTSALVSESRWDVEELLLRCSFLPKRGLHALLRQLWHQAVRGGRAAMFRPARQLRRAVELASPFSPHLCPSAPSILIMSRQHHCLLDFFVQLI